MKAGRLLLVLAVLFAVSASYWLGRELGRREGEAVPRGRDTVRIVEWKRDTGKVESSKPAGSVQAWLPAVAAPAAPEEQAAPDTVILRERDTVLVEVPIEEKEVAGENYRAVLRGFQPEIVDIWVKRETDIVRVPVRKRWSVTAGPQVGVGITPEGWRPYAGLGVTFGYCF